MKKIFLVVTSFSFIAMGYTQKKQEGHFALGVKAGANLTKISGKSFSEEFNLTYQVGAFMEIDFNKNVGIQPEILWSQTQGKTSSGLSSIYTGLTQPQGGSNVKLNYLSIPILLRYNVGNLLTLHAGPQFGVLINENQNIFANSRDAFAKGDFGMIGGAQLNLKNLRVYGRYNIGLNNLNDIDDKDKWKSQQIQLGVGFKF